MTTLPASISDLARSVNVAFTSAVDQQLQYQQAGFALHTWMQALGYSVESSGNGAGTFGAGNNITTSTHIVFASAGSAHSWAVYKQGNTYIAIDFISPAPDTTPQFITVYRSEAAYTNTAGTNTTRPTTFAGFEMTMTTPALIPWATPGAGVINYQYSASANVGWFMVKPTGGDGSVAFFMVIDKPDSSDPTYDTGPVPAVLVTSGGVVTNSFNTSSTTMLPKSDSTANSNNPAAVSAVWIDCAFGGGANFTFADGLGRLTNVHWIVDLTLTGGRDAGVSRILKGIPVGSPFNARDPADPGGDLWTWWTVGDIAVLWLKSDGDML